MPLRRAAIALLLILGAACGGDDASALDPGDYFTQLATITENARIQERGLARDLAARVEAAGGEPPLQVVEVHVGQLVRLYEDVTDALVALEPDETMQLVHDAYVAAWQDQLDLLLKVRDAAFESGTAYLDSITNLLTDTRAETRARCEDLQAAIATAGSEVELTCEGRAA
jgi:hypothetical protein